MKIINEVLKSLTEDIDGEENIIITSCRIVIFMCSIFFVISLLYKIIDLILIIIK